MAWFRVDDNFYDHPKVDELSLEAVGIWLLCGTYVAKHLTDGFIPTRRVTKLGGSEHLANELVEAELWDIADGGYTFRNWTDYQPTRDAVEAKREADRERQRRKRRNDKGQYIADESQESHAVTPPRVESESHHPSPAQPVPAHSEGRTSRKTRIPDDWEPTDSHKKRAAEKNLDLDEESEKFRNWAIANDRKYVDWGRTFSNWLINARPKPQETYDPWQM